MKFPKCLCVILLLLAVVPAEGCRPAIDGCAEGAHRCSPSGIPQECSNKRWHNGDRPCSENRLPGGQSPVCCETNSEYAGRVLHACVTPDRCLNYATEAQDGGTGDVR